MKTYDHVTVVTDTPIEPSVGRAGLKTQLGGYATSIANISRSSDLLQNGKG